MGAVEEGGKELLSILLLALLGHLGDAPLDFVCHRQLLACSPACLLSVHACFASSDSEPRHKQRKFVNIMRFAVYR